MSSVVVLLVCCALAGAVSGQGEPCTVDDAGTRGDCRRITDCPEVMRIARTAQANISAHEHTVDWLRMLVGRCPLPRTANGRPRRGFMLCCRNEPTRVATRMRYHLAEGDDCQIHLSQRVTGGEDAEIGQFPWMVSIQVAKTPDSAPVHFCGGSLITSRHVLTAAHCVSYLATPEFPDVTPVSVIIGEVDFNSDIDCLKDDPSVCGDRPVTIEIEAIYPHPSFQNIQRLALPRDIAVVRLARDVTFSDFIRPICLDLRNESSGPNGVVAGWGRTSASVTGPTFTPILQYARLPLRELSECEQVFGRRLPGRLCAGGGPNSTDTCRGDSGGPLMRFDRHGVRAFLTGVSSFGTTVCGRIAGYTDVADYADWIVEQINK